MMTFPVGVTCSFIYDAPTVLVMQPPRIVKRRLDGESVLTAVELGGADTLYVTPSRLVIYRADGLLSDERAQALPLGAERIGLQRGRRKSTLRLEYINESQELSVPSRRLSEVLAPLLGGLLRVRGEVDADERVRGAYRFSELTLLVTDRRIARHVGAMVWEEEFEEAAYKDLTGLQFKQGSVGTEMTVEIDGYPQRFKVPNEHVREVKQAIQDAVFAFHGVTTMEQLHAAVEPEPSEQASRSEPSQPAEPADPPLGELSATELAVDAGRERDRDREGATTDIRNLMGGANLEGGVRGQAGPQAGAGATVDSDGETVGAVLGRLDALEAAVDRQATLLENQQAAIEQLVEELKRART